MRFSLSEEQRAFTKALDGLLEGSSTPQVARSWAQGDHGPGKALWARLAEIGVSALQVPEEHGGIGGSPLDVVVAFDRLGFHAVPGPWIESTVLAPALLVGTSDADRLERLAAGEMLVSVAAPPVAPRALDGDAADDVYLLEGATLHRASVHTLVESVDPTRRLGSVRAGEVVAALDDRAVSQALDAASLACAAMLVGAGERLLRDSVDYVGSRRQFGRVIGEYQALKHALADVRVGLDFARPLLHGAALELGAGSEVASRDVSAAMVASSAAAHRAARTALQVHGAIGYTLEFDLSLWLLKVRALLSAWGTAGHHRARVLDALTRS